MPISDTSNRPSILRKLRSAVAGKSVDAPASVDNAKEESKRWTLADFFWRVAENAAPEDPKS